MKQLTTLLLFLCTFSFTLTAHYTELVGDTIQIDLKDYTEGLIQWQFSPDKTTWTNEENSFNSHSLELIYHYLCEK